MIVFVIYLIKLYESGIFTLQISIYAVKKPVDIERGDKLPCFYSLFVNNCCMLFVCAFLFVSFFSPYFCFFCIGGCILGSYFCIFFVFVLVCIFVFPCVCLSCFCICVYYCVCIYRWCRWELNPGMSD